MIQLRTAYAFPFSHITQSTLLIKYRHALNNETLRKFHGNVSIICAIQQMENALNSYLDTLLPKPGTNKAFISIVSRVGVLKDIAVSTVKLALLRERKESLITAIHAPNL